MGVTFQWRLLFIAILSVILWELLKFTFKRMFSLTYYKRESEDVVIQVKVMPWDMDGQKHFTEQGYTREFPELKE